MRKNLILLALILLTSFFLRFFELGANPPSLTWDEVAWGYNAYSLGIDGKDEFGRFLPVDYIESFGDFKPPVYAYLSIIPIKIFGLNEFAVRFPSAFFGVLSVLVTYLLVKRIFYNSKIKEELALFSSFLLAVSPWHFMLSRAAFEANIASFFILSGVWLFLFAIQEKRWLILLSVFSFVLSIYTFNSARIVAPLIILVLVFAFRNELIKNKKETVVAFIFGILLILPIAQFLISPQASLRFKEVNIFSDIGVVQNSNQQIANDNNSMFSKVIHNRRLMYAVSYLNHYFDNLSSDFLFIKGDGNPKFSTQRVGQLYLWELPFFILGILYLLKKKEGYFWLIPVWLIVALIPAGFARETPHALRIENSLPTFQILSAYGFLTVLGFFEKYKKVFLGGMGIIIVLSFIYFYHDYMTHYKRIFSGEWQYGYKESIEYVKKVEKDYDSIYITNELGRPYIYYLFYNKTDPQEFRRNAEVSRDVFGFVKIDGLGKYRFAKDLSGLEGKILYIDLASKVPFGANILKNFNLLNGKQVLTAYSL